MIEELCPYEGRGTGRTSWMIQHLINSVMEGQPKCVVVAANSIHRNKLFSKIRCMLVSRKVVPLIMSTGRITADGCVIDFATVGTIEAHRIGRRGYGEFWDHFAWDEFCAQSPYPDGAKWYCDKGDSNEEA